MAENKVIDDSPYDYEYHENYPFCPLDGVVVFDHLVTKDLLQGAELIVLTGECVSPGTQRGVLECVEEGARCLALPHLVPDRMRGDRGNVPFEIPCGRGRFLVTSDFCDDASREFVRPHLGPDDAVRYRFGDRHVSISRCDCGRSVLRMTSATVESS
jgi:hypothetical protein